MPIPNIAQNNTTQGLHNHSVVENKMGWSMATTFGLYYAGITCGRFHAERFGRLRVSFYLKSYSAPTVSSIGILKTPPRFFPIWRCVTHSSVFGLTTDRFIHRIGWQTSQTRLWNYPNYYPLQCSASWPCALLQQPLMPESAVKRRKTVSNILTLVRQMAITMAPVQAMWLIMWLHWFVVGMTHLPICNGSRSQKGKQRINGNVRVAKLEA